MSESYLPIEGDALTALIVSVFRLNGALHVAGDRLVEDLGLTTARWQVIGVVATSPTPLPIASIARNMGLTRQAVRSVTNDLASVGLVKFVANPHHRRAHLVVLTDEGERVHRAAKKRQRPWSRRLRRGLSQGRIEEAAQLLQSLLTHLDTNGRHANEKP